MAQPGRRSLLARIGAGALLLVVAVVCPLMAAGAVPAAPSCHERSDHERRDDAPAIGCCAAIKGVRSLPSVQQPVAPAPAAVDTGPDPVLHVDHRLDRVESGPPRPPLFLQHAALLI